MRKLGKSRRCYLDQGAGRSRPGYGSTAKMLGQAGLCLAEDFPPSVKAEGFWTPASMFGEVFIERLVKAAGLTFEVC